jgi:Domain of unknown function (DUF1905)/Bacteriocin-protection, YdeI or OmpD-Associated
MSTIHFEAKVSKIKDWTILKLPKSVSIQLPSRGQVMVNGTINGFEILSALEPDGGGGHWLHIDPDMQKSTKLNVGDTATLAIEPTKEWPEPFMPADWKTALAADAQANKQYTSLTPMARWEWIRWINATGQAVTRAKRIEVSRSKLRAGERRPCCFNRSMCCVPDVSKNGVLLEPTEASSVR